MTLQQQIREIVRVMPRGASVTLPVDFLRELLEEGAAAGEGGIRPDLTVQEVAEGVGRAASTVRTWCGEGRLPGAYRLLNREWRIPHAALDEFLRCQREGQGTPPQRPPGPNDLVGPANISAWRSEFKKKGGG